MLILERERQGGRKKNFEWLPRPSMHSLVDSHVCVNWDQTATLAYLDNAPANGAAQPGQNSIS